MKRVGIINTPLSTGHAVRGVGFYTRGLLSEISSIALPAGIEVVEISSPSSSFDLVHYPFFDLFAHSLPLFPKAKQVVTIHDVIPLQFPQHYPPGLKGTANFWLQKIALNSASAVITDSYASVNEIRRFLHVPDEKIKLAYLAPAASLKPAKSLAVLKKFHLPKKFILCVNDLNYNKNIPNLVQASHQLQVPLVLVGKQAAQLETMDLRHPELAHLQQLSPFLNSPLFIRPGFVSDEELSAFYSAASVYCHPSFAEGFGIGVANALSCGCPVICSDASCLPEIAGDAAVYVNPYQVESISEGISKVLADAALRKHLAVAGKKQISQFSWKKTALQTLQVYQQALLS